MRKQSVFLLALIISVASCKKQMDEQICHPENFIRRLKVADVVMPYIFKEGSFWVYTNQQTLVEDSITLLSGIDTFFTTTICSTYIDTCDFHKQYLKSWTLNYQYSELIQQIAITRNSIIQGGEFYADSFKMKYFGQIIYYHSDNRDLTDRGIHGTEYFTTYDIGGHTFQNVTEYKIKASEQIQNEFDFDTHLYFSPNYGIIKKEIFDTVNGTQTWNLKSWNIIQ